MPRLVITIYAIYLYNRLYPSQMNIINMILLCIFPVFFIAATATIHINYLNPLYDEPVEDYDYENFMKDLQNLENINVKFFFIFIPIYLFLSYILYNRSINIIVREKNIKKGIESMIREKVKDIKSNKLYYLIVGILSRYRFSFAKSTLTKIIR
jgi:hypothetical protein